MSDYLDEIADAVANVHEDGSVARVTIEGMCGVLKRIDVSLPARVPCPHAEDDVCVWNHMGNECPPGADQADCTIPDAVSPDAESEAGGDIQERARLCFYRGDGGECYADGVHFGPCDPTAKYCDLEIREQEHANRATEEPTPAPRPRRMQVEFPTEATFDDGEAGGGRVVCPEAGACGDYGQGIKSPCLRHPMADADCTIPDPEYPCDADDADTRRRIHLAESRAKFQEAFAKKQTEKVERLQRENARLRAELTRANERMDEMSGENERLRGARDALADQWRDAQECLDDLYTEANQLRRENQRFRANASKVKRVVEAMSGEVQAGKAVDDLIDWARGQVSAYRNVLHWIDNIERDPTIDLSSVGQWEQKHVDAITDLKSENDRLRLEVATLKAKDSEGVKIHFPDTDPPFPHPEEENPPNVMVGTSRPDVEEVRTKEDLVRLVGAGHDPLSPLGHLERTLPSEKDDPDGDPTRGDGVRQFTASVPIGKDDVVASLHAENKRLAGENARLTDTLDELRQDKAKLQELRSSLSAFTGQLVDDQGKGRSYTPEIVLQNMESFEVIGTDTSGSFTFKGESIPTEQTDEVERRRWQDKVDDDGPCAHTSINGVTLKCTHCGVQMKRAEGGWYVPARDNSGESVSEGDGSARTGSVPPPAKHGETRDGVDWAALENMPHIDCTDQHVMTMDGRTHMLARAVLRLRQRLDALENPPDPTMPTDCLACRHCESGDMGFRCTEGHKVATGDCPHYDDGGE